MKKILTVILSLIFISDSFSCDKTSISITSVVNNGAYYTYTAQVCIGISPNWGETNSFCINADKNIINSVSDILLDVKKNGDQALIERTLLYDKANLNKSEIILLVFVLCFPNKKGKKL